MTGREKKRYKRKYQDSDVLIIQNPLVIIDREQKTIILLGKSSYLQPGTAVTTNFYCI